MDFKYLDTYIMPTFLHIGHPQPADFKIDHHGNVNDVSNTYGPWAQPDSYRQK